jgi:hypothetical protein
MFYDLSVPDVEIAPAAFTVARLTEVRVAERRIK